MPGEGEAVEAQLQYYAPEKNQYQHQKTANVGNNASLELTDRRLLISPSALEAWLMKVNPVYWLTFGSTDMRNQTERIAIDYSSISRVYFLDYSSTLNTVLSTLNFSASTDEQVKIAAAAIQAGCRPAGLDAHDATVASAVP